MIKIREAKTKKMPGLTSLFIQTPYNKLVVETIKSYGISDYDDKTQTWEVPVMALSYLLDRLSVLDEIEITLLKDEKQKAITYVQPQGHNVTLFKHQEEAVAFGLAHEKWLLLDSPGLGKTLSIIRLAEERRKLNGLNHCLIICGLNTLKSNWKQEIEKFSDLDAIILGQHITRNGNVTTKSIKERVEQLKNPIKEFFVITNIETLRDDGIVEQINKGVNQFDMIVIDEVHVCKSTTSAQGKNTLKLNKAKYKVGATGTLLLNDPMDTYLPLKWIGAERSTQSTFKYYYCEYGGPFGNMLLGFRHMDQLKDQIEQYSLRRTKDLLNLPEKIIIDEKVEMEPVQNAFYENIKHGIVTQVDKVKMSTANLLAMCTRLRQATECPSVLTTENIPSSKVDRCIDLAEQILSDPSEKVVIFSVFKEELIRICDRLQKYKPLLCTGDVSDEVITRNRIAFQEDNEHRVIVCTCQKMGTGVTLNRAHYAIFLSTPWTEGVQTQCEDRIHRIGTNQTVFIYRLWTHNTFDERVLDILNTKGALSEYVIDDTVTEQTINILRQYIMDLK